MCVFSLKAEPENHLEDLCKIDCPAPELLIQIWHGAEDMHF